MAGKWASGTLCFRVVVTDIWCQNCILCGCWDTKPGPYSWEFILCKICYFPSPWFIMLTLTWHYVTLSNGFSHSHLSLKRQTITVFTWRRPSWGCLVINPHGIDGTEELWFHKKKKKEKKNNFRKIVTKTLHLSRRYIINGVGVHLQWNSSQEAVSETVSDPASWVIHVTGGTHQWHRCPSYAGDFLVANILGHLYSCNSPFTHNCFIDQDK